MEIQRQQARRFYEEGLRLAGTGHPELPEYERDAFALAYTAGCLGVESCFVLGDDGLPLVRDGQVAMRLQ